MNLLIEKTHWDKSGIYAITCLGNGKVYIGSAIKLARRFWQHDSELSLNKHANQKLQRSYNKYGPTKFTFSLVELVDIQSNLIPREQFYIDTFQVVKNGLNICPIAGSNRGRKCTPEQNERNRQKQLGKTISPQTREKISIANKGRVKTAEEKLKLSKAKKGKKHSDEFKAKMSILKTGVYHTDKAKEKISKTLTGIKRSQETILKIKTTQGKAILQFDLSYNLIAEFTGCGEAGKQSGIPFQNISKCCLGKRPTAGGYIWIYKKDYESNNQVKVIQATKGYITEQKTA